MSDLTAYTVAADLADFFADQIDSITVPDGCSVPDRIYAAAGEPDVWPSQKDCGEIVVWIPAIAPSTIPNQDAGLSETSCSFATFVEVRWRFTHCVTPVADPNDPRKQTSVDVMEADAACFYSLAYGLWRRLQVNIGDVFTGQPDCNKISQGRFEVGRRAGATLSVAQSLRVQVELTDPLDDGS